MQCDVYICDGCGTEVKAHRSGSETPLIEKVGEDRHYCVSDCLPHVRALMKRLHKYLESVACEYRKEYAEGLEELRRALPGMSRSPQPDEIRIVIGDPDA